MLTACEFCATLQPSSDGRGNHKKKNQHTSWLEFAFSLSVGSVQVDLSDLCATID